MRFAVFASSELALPGFRLSLSELAFRGFRLERIGASGLSPLANLRFAAFASFASALRCFRLLRICASRLSLMLLDARNSKDGNCGLFEHSAFLLFLNLRTVPP
jgi:hypothetical protein